MSLDGKKEENGGTSPIGKIYLSNIIIISSSSSSSNVKQRIVNAKNDCISVVSVAMDRLTVCFISLPETSSVIMSFLLLPSIVIMLLTASQAHYVETSAIDGEALGPRIFKIVLTGGPCGGKTTALARLSEFFRTHGMDDEL